MKLNYDLKLLENLGFKEGKYYFEYYIDDDIYRGIIFVNKETRDVCVSGNINFEIGIKLIDKIFELFKVERQFDATAVINNDTPQLIAMTIENEVLKCASNVSKLQKDRFENAFDMAIEVLTNIGGDDCCGCKYHNTDICNFCEDKEKLKEYFLNKSINRG